MTELTIAGPLASRQLSLVREETVNEFWSSYGEPMRPDNKAACAKIALAMEDEYSVASGGPATAQLCLWLHDVQKTCEECGGKRGWALAVEARLGGLFKRMPTSVPASAALFEPASGTSLKALVKRGKITQLQSLPKYSDELIRAGKLDSMRISDARLEECLVDTEDPLTTRISTTEKSNVLQCCFEWRLARKSVGQDKNLSRVMARQLRNKFPHIPGAEWKKSLKYLSGNRGRKDAEVAPRLPPRACTPPFTPGLARTSSMSPPPPPPPPELLSAFISASVPPRPVGPLFKGAPDGEPAGFR